MTSKKEKLRAQVKSRFYYLFWGAATVSVFAGQLYVGSGYRKMSKSVEKIMNNVQLIIELPKHIDPWDRDSREGLWYPTDPPESLH